MRFENVSTEGGIKFQREDDIGPLHRILESNGGGVGLFDYDLDGWLDVCYTNGCKLPFSEPAERKPDVLLRNRSGSRFESVGQSAGMMIPGYHHGVAAGDWNNDGFPDLYVTALGRNLFYINQGDGTFVERGEELRIGVPLWSSSTAWGDLDLDGNLDLYVANYTQTADDPPRLCPDKNAPDGYITCPPTVLDGEPDVCFRSDGSGQFADVTQIWGLFGDEPKGLGCAISDFDQDGRPDVYIANDGVPNFLFHNQRDADQPKFQNEAFLRGVAVDGNGRAEASMGIAIGDYDRNGWLDLFLSHFFSETNTLYQASAGGYFRDRTNAARLAESSRSSLGFGTLFIDVENDGWLDLFVGNGHIDDMRWRVDGLKYRMPSQLYLNRRDGTFQEISPHAGTYFRNEWLSRGVAAGDLNHDGLIDLGISHQLDPSTILINRTETANQSVSVRCIGTQSNRSAISTKLWAEVNGHSQYVEIVGGGSYQSASDLRVHIGLERAERIASLQVRWPNGIEAEFTNLAAGRYTLIENQGLFPDHD